LGPDGAGGGGLPRPFFGIERYPLFRPSLVGHAPSAHPLGVG